MKKEALLYEKLDANYIKCKLCSHRCKIAPGKTGICGVRKNERGILYTTVYGSAIAANVDPIEKKPFYHFLPGSSAFSIATVGCNFRCGFCQNWQISQVRDSDYYRAYQLEPRKIIESALRANCASISYTYTEPTIFFEYAYNTAILAKENGLCNNFVTNGYMTKEAIDLIAPYLDAANVDLKSFRDEYYRKICKARLEPVLESIKYMKELNIWIEVTTLVIPGENDSEEELNDIAEFLAKLDPEIPWHISRFHPDYQFTDHEATPLETLKKAYRIGQDHGLRYIYLGNVLEGNDTICYNCGKTLIKRWYYSIVENNIKEGKCRFCGSEIAGIWR